MANSQVQFSVQLEHAGGGEGYLLDLMTEIERLRREYAVATANKVGCGLLVAIFDWETRYYLDTSILQGFVIERVIKDDPPPEGESLKYRIKLIDDDKYEIEYITD